VTTKRTEALSSQGATRRRQGAMGTSCTGRGFILTQERNFFTVRTVLRWNNLLRDVVESSLLEFFKMQSDRVLY